MWGQGPSATLWPVSHMKQVLSIFNNVTEVNVCVGQVPLNTHTVDFFFAYVSIQQIPPPLIGITNQWRIQGRGQGGLAPPLPHRTHTKILYDFLCSAAVDPACIGCSDMRKCYKKITPAWSRSGYAIVHRYHCEYNWCNTQ